MAGCCARTVEVERCILPVERPLTAETHRKLGLITRDTISVLPTNSEIMLTAIMYPRDIWNLCFEFLILRFGVCN